MSRGGAAAFADQSALSLLLKEPRYEVIPVQGIEQKVAALPYGATVTITASPKLGMDRTLDVSTALAARGFRVVPHLAARMVAGRGHLERLVQRLDGVADPRGRSWSAETPTRRRGTTPTPATCSRSSPDSLIPSRASASAATRRATRSSATTACSRRCAASSRSPATWSRSCASTRRPWPRGCRTSARPASTCPSWSACRASWSGASWPRSRSRPASGSSLRYLRKHGRQIVTLARSRRYDPTVAGRGGRRLRRPIRRSACDGVHLFTFNQVEQTRDWVAGRS